MPFFLRVMDFLEIVLKESWNPEYIMILFCSESPVGIGASSWTACCASGAFGKISTNSMTPSFSPLSKRGGLPFKSHSIWVTLCCERG